MPLPFSSNSPTPPSHGLIHQGLRWGALLLLSMGILACGPEAGGNAARQGDAHAQTAQSRSPLGLEVTFERISSPGETLEIIEGELHPANSFLLFAGGEPDDIQLWRASPVTGEAMLVLRLADTSSTPRNFVRSGSSNFFVADSPSESDPHVEPRLWLTYGGLNDTIQLPTDPNPQILGATPDGVLLMAEDESGTAQPWFSDGSVEGTRALELPEDTSAGEMVAEPAVSSGDLSYFVYNTAAEGEELWVFKSGEEGPRPVTDLTPGSSDTMPRELVSLGGGRIAFIAGALNALCLSDGSTEGTVCDDSFGSLSNLQVHQGQLLVVNDEGPDGTFLEKMDPQINEAQNFENRQKLHADSLTEVVNYVATPSWIYVQNGDSNAELYSIRSSPSDEQPEGELALLGSFDDVESSSLTPVGDAVLFVASAEGNSGLWTAAAQNAPRFLGAGDPEDPLSQPRSFVLQSQRVFFVADQSQPGAWWLPATAVDTPPSIQCPAGTLNLTGDVPGGANLTAALNKGDLEIQMEDAESELELSLNSWQSSWGNTSVTATVQDALGSVAECTVSITTTHPEAPSLSCPEEVRAESPVPQPRIVEFEVEADHPLAPVNLIFSHESGAEFPYGLTQITVEAQAANSSVECEFDVVVEDTTPPEIVCPDNITEEAEGPGGAIVSWSDPEVISEESNVQFIHDSLSGEHFPLGDTLVTISATDNAGNTSQCQFTITVQDTTAPELECPDDMTLPAVSKSGVKLTQPTVIANDAVSSPSLEFNPPLGDYLSVGTHSIEVRAKDDAGNTSECSYSITVTAPADGSELPDDEEEFEDEEDPNGDDSSDDPAGPEDDDGGSDSGDNQDGDGSDEGDEDEDDEGEDAGEDKVDSCGSCSSTGFAASWAFLIPMFSMFARKHRRRQQLAQSAVDLKL